MKKAHTLRYSIIDDNGQLWAEVTYNLNAPDGCFFGWTRITGSHQHIIHDGDHRAILTHVDGQPVCTAWSFLAYS